MTEGLAKAFGPTVRVNTLMPGPFLTDISTAWNFGDANPFADFALSRAGNPDEIVGAALFSRRTRRVTPPGRSCTSTADTPEG